MCFFEKEKIFLTKSQRFHHAVAGDVFNGVLFCAVIFPTRCLG